MYSYDFLNRRRILLISVLQLYSTQNQACIEKLQLLVKTQSDDLINAHEDVLTYNERYAEG